MYQSVLISWQTHNSLEWTSTLSCDSTFERVISPKKIELRVLVGLHHKHTARVLARHNRCAICVVHVTCVMCDVRSVTCDV
jgi:hypothetical protein